MAQKKEIIPYGERRRGWLSWLFGSQSDTVRQPARHLHYVGEQTVRFRRDLPIEIPIGVGFVTSSDKPLHLRTGRDLFRLMKTATSMVIDELGMQVIMPTDAKSDIHTRINGDFGTAEFVAAFFRLRGKRAMIKALDTHDFVTVMRGDVVSAEKVVAIDGRKHRTIFERWAPPKLGIPKGADMVHSVVFHK